MGRNPLRDQCGEGKPFSQLEEKLQKVFFEQKLPQLTRKLEGKGVEPRERFFPCVSRKVFLSVENGTFFLKKGFHPEIPGKFPKLNSPWNWNEPIQNLPKVKKGKFLWLKLGT